MLHPKYKPQKDGHKDLSRPTKALRKEATRKERHVWRWVLRNILMA